MPQSPLLAPGTAFADYEVESVVGRGGMGVVYRARDVRLDRTVALKLLAPEFTAHEKFRARFLRESAPGGRRGPPEHHPDLRGGRRRRTAVHRHALRPGRGPAHRADRRSRLPWQRRCPSSRRWPTRWTPRTPPAWSTATSNRATSCSPIRPGRARHAYLTDFGLTRRSASISGLTTSGHFLGTLDYVAPEQIRGDAVDGRADVYSFACVAYAVLVGRPPFDQEDDIALMWAHISRDPPRAGALEPELTGAVEEALAAGMAKAPDQRPETCGALLALMEPFQADRRSGPHLSGLETRETRRPIGSPSLVPPVGGPLPPVPSRRPPVEQETGPEAAPDSPPRKGRRRLPARWLVAAVALIAVAAALGVFLLRGRDPEYTTFSDPDVPYTLDVPANWSRHTHLAGDSTVTVLSPTDLTGLFADNPAGMRAAAAAVASDASSVVGLAIYHRARLDSDAPAGQLGPAQALLPGQDVELRPGKIVTVGDIEATDMPGAFGLGKDASLQVRVLALRSNPRQILVLFAPPSVFAQQTETFARVTDSLATTP